MRVGGRRRVSSADRVSRRSRCSPCCCTSRSRRPSWSTRCSLKSAREPSRRAMSRWRSMKPSSSRLRLDRRSMRFSLTTKSRSSRWRRLPAKPARLSWAVRPKLPPSRVLQRAPGDWHATNARGQPPPERFRSKLKNMTPMPAETRLRPQRASMNTEIFQDFIIQVSMSKRCGSPEVFERDVIKLNANDSCHSAARLPLRMDKRYSSRSMNKSQAVTGKT